MRVTLVRGAPWVGGGGISRARWALAERPIVASSRSVIVSVRIRSDPYPSWSGSTSVRVRFGLGRPRHWFVLVTARVSRGTVAQRLMGTVQPGRLKCREKAGLLARLGPL